MEAAVQTAKETAATGAPQATNVVPIVAPIARYGWLPCQLSLEIPVTNFTVRDLLQLHKGSILRTDCSHAGDIPLRANGLLICWTEFEVIGARLAVRVTELA